MCCVCSYFPALSFPWQYLDVVYFACKVISGSSGFKYLYCLLMLACELSANVIVSIGFSLFSFFFFFNSFLGGEVGELERKVQGPLCAVR